MSTLRVSNIQDTSGGNNSTPAAIANGVAKAWIAFNGTTSTPTVRGSYNVSSITDNGQGDYTINFSTALADGNYSVVATAISFASQANGRVFGVYATDDNGTNATVTASAVRLLYRGGAQGDTGYANVAVFR